MGSMEQVTGSSDICKSKYKIHQLCRCVDKLSDAQNFYVNKALRFNLSDFSLYVWNAHKKEN